MPAQVSNAMPWRGQVLVRTGRAVARDRAEHDLGVDLLQLLEAEAALGERAGAHRLDHRVGVADELEVDLDRLGLAQVERDAALVAVDVEVQQRVALDDRPRHLADVVALGRLDLDDVGAEVGEEAAELARAEQRALDHPDTVEEGGTIGHGVVLLLQRGGQGSGRQAVRAIADAI